MAAFIALASAMELRQEAVSWVGLTGRQWWTYPGGYLVEWAFILIPAVVSVVVLVVVVLLSSRIWLRLVARKEVAWVWAALVEGLLYVICTGAAVLVGLLG